MNLKLLSFFSIYMKLDILRTIVEKQIFKLDFFIKLLLRIFYLSHLISQRYFFNRYLQFKGIS